MLYHGVKTEEGVLMRMIMFRAVLLNAPVKTLRPRTEAGAENTLSLLEKASEYLKSLKPDDWAR